MMERYQVDQRVIFRRTGGSAKFAGQWYEGKIVSATGSPSSYRVQEYELYCSPVGGLVDAPTEEEPPINLPGETYTVANDRDHIRVLPQEAAMMDKFWQATMASPTFRDPYARLYMTPDHSTGGEHGGVEDVNIGGRMFSTAVVQIPDDGRVDPEEVVALMAEVPNRRRAGSCALGVLSGNIRKILDSVLPDYIYADLEYFKERANRDPSVMLQFADALNYGLMGIPKNKDRALAYYLCAAWGMSEEESEQTLKDVRFGYPMGTPEALCAAATAMWNQISQVLGTESIPSIIEYIKRTNDRAAMGLLQQVVAYFGHAFRRGWTCPAALQIGQVMREFEFLDPFLPDSFSLIQALELKNTQENELDPNLLEKLKLPSNFSPSPEMMAEFSSPSDEQLEMFQPKATEIFLSLPAKVIAPSGLVRIDLHVEYRELPFPPYPIVLIPMNPHSTYLYPFINIPEELEYTPYSKDAFNAIWGRIVFNMHMGDKRGNTRYRPSVITFVDRPGDRKLAAYIKSLIGTNCGTEIRVINPREYTIKLYGGRSESLFNLMLKMVDGVTESLRSTMVFKESEMRNQEQQANTAFQNLDVPVEELLSKLERLKEEGNRYFVQKRMQVAQRCYTEAIDTVRTAVNTDYRVHGILGTLLSNRVACFLKMSEGMGPDSAKTALKKAIDDCNAALNSRWSSVISRNIRFKIMRRKEEAIKGVDRLVSQSQTTLLPTTHEQSGQHPDEEDLQISRGAAQQGGGRRRRNKKKGKQKRRRKRGTNSRPDQAQNVDTVSDVSGSVGNNGDVDIFDSGSILLGKDLLDSQLAEHISEKEDPCPVCFDRYCFELSDTHILVNSCGHACCMPCLSRMWKKNTRRSNSIPFTCPMCRFPLREDLISDAVGPIISQTESLQERLTLLPLEDEERHEVAKNLLKLHDFVITNVQRALDAMLTDRLQSSLRQSTSLTPSEKQQIYEEARSPVDKLNNEVKDLSTYLSLIRDYESDEYKSTFNQIKGIQKTLIPLAQAKAKDLIWERMNTAGSMGTENLSGEIEVDFHALHVKEAEEIFDKQVLPFLQAAKKVLLVVGRGNHSEGNVAKLKPALRRYIDRHDHRRFMKHNSVPGNDGVIRVVWKK